MGKNDNMEERAAKAFKQVEKAADDARKLVTSKMREARYERRKVEQQKLSREAKRLKREEHLSNHVIGERLGLSESSVRTLLLMKIEGDI